MTGNVTPSQYLKAARQDFKNLPADICNDLLNGEWSAAKHILYIPDYIPSKYHARMQATWTVMVFKILFANATNRYSLIQRHKMLQNALTMHKCSNTSER